MNGYSSKERRELASVEEYETLIAAIPGGIVITEADDAFTILFANQGYYNMVGYEKNEHIAKFNNIGINTLHPDEAEAAAKSAKEQLAATGAFNVKAKLSHKYKEYIWVHFSGKLSMSPDGSARIYIVIVDISEHLNILESFEKEQSLNELIAALSDDAFFDFDVPNRTMRLSRNFANRMGVEEIMHDFPQPFLQKGVIAPDSIKAFEHDLTAFFSDMNCVSEQEIHYILPDEGDVWYLIRTNVTVDANGVPERVVGKMSDITRHKEQIDELSEMAQKDQLTGLYNKTATERLIKEILKMRRIHDDKHALFIIDIDNFKNINDRLGHLYGDIVLTQLAEGIKPIFRSDDVIGRVGGDEFFVLIKNYRTTDLLKEKAEDICNLFRKTYTDHNASVDISASIGIALCPENGIHFDELYKNADTALYNTKANGKNGYTFYDIKTAKPYLSTRTEIDTHGGVQKSFKDNRIEYVFKLLYGSENPVTSIKSVLQLATESLGFSRGYIFETSPDGKTTSNTFEWCSEGITAEMHNLQNIPIEAVATSTDSFYKTGMFILRSLDELPPLERAVLEPQGIRSMFQFGIMEGKKLVGFIGFDDCEKERVPTDAEVDEIGTICHVLATFLLKHRIVERETRHHKAIETIIDNMNSFAYVIDQDDYLVLYENQNTVQLIGKPSVGQKCHLSYRGKDKPCEDCPMTALSDTKSRHTVEIHNTVYDVYVRADAAWINWSDGRKACLISSVDITEYKKDKLS